jgi:hypothetical protein
MCLGARMMGFISAFRMDELIPEYFNETPKYPHPITISA